MAKIVVFSDSILDTHASSYFSKQVVNHAAETANEIYFVTQNDGDNELKAYHPKVQILRPFRKWNFVEATKLLPILFQVRADIFHFIEPRTKIGLGHALPILAAFAKTMHTKNILSLLDYDPKLSRGLETMIASSEVVSVIDPLQALPLQKRFRRVEIEFLPASIYQDSSGADENSSVEGSYIFLPENLNQYDRWPHLVRICLEQMKQKKDLSLVVTGSLLDFDLQTRRQILQLIEPIAARTRWTGPLSRKNKLPFLKSAEAVILAGLKFSPYRLHENLGLALAAQASTILTYTQVQTSQLPIQNNQHAKVIEESQIENALAELLESVDKRMLLRNNLAQLKQFHSEDELGNRLSRMYAKLLS